MASAPMPLLETPVSAEAARLYRLIAETIPHIVWTARADGTVNFLNRRAYEYTGAAAGSLEGWAWRVAFHPEDVERVGAAWTRSLQTGEQFSSEYRLRRADGAYRWYHGSAVPLRDAAGHIAHWFGTCTDIENEVRSAQILEGMVEERTRKLHESTQALLQSEQRFQMFMEHLPGLAWVRDAQLRFTYVNRLYRETVGRTSEELLGRGASAAHPEDVAAVYRRTDEDVQRSGKPRHFVEEDSSGRWLKVKFPLPDAAGGTGVAGIALDLSDRARLENEHARSVRLLLDRLVSAQESERRRLADDLHDLIGQNLTALGIDLASLSQRLRGADVQAGPRLEAMRALLEKTIDAIRGVMSDLRPPALEEFGLEAALRAYAAEFSERTGMRATVSLDGAPGRLSRESELALFRIAQEALTNAAKHSGGSAVAIALAAQGPRVCLSVEDDGRGFADPVGARSARRGGWGLATMRERAEARGGTLRIEFPGRGTRLVAEVPAA